MASDSPEAGDAVTNERLQRPALDVRCEVADVQIGAHRAPVRVAHELDGARAQRRDAAQLLSVARSVVVHALAVEVGPTMERGHLAQPTFVEPEPLRGE